MALLQLTKGIPKHVCLTSRRANAWLHVGRPIRSSAGNGILCDTPDWPEKDEHHGDTSFQHSELHRYIPEPALGVFFGQTRFAYYSHDLEVRKRSLGTLREGRSTYWVSL